jgi:trehalose 6-phosphate phosphatase
VTEPRQLPPVLVPLREHAGEAALFLDYDGTLAPIVPDPAGARPLRGVPELLARLAERLGLVAVVSGRPARFLLEALDRPPGVHLAGLYGMEEVAGDGVVRTAPEAERFRATVEEVTRAAAGEAPPGVEVEPKGLTVTLHWRRAPAEAQWVRETARRAALRTGLVAQPGRMAVELRPPVGVDKGTLVERWSRGYGVAVFFGDDLGDLPAFAVLGALAGRGVSVARVAVADDETPPEVAAAADLVVDGPREAVHLLHLVAGDLHR